MSEVEFDESSNRPNSRFQRDEKPSSSINNFLFKTGIAKDEKEAQVVSLILVIVILAATIFIYFHFVKTSASTPTPNQHKVISPITRSINPNSYEHFV